MLEPSLALQSAVRAALVNDPTFAALVEPQHVRTGPGRPEQFPCVIFGSAQTEFLGRAAGGQACARVLLTLHVWAADNLTDTPKAIGFALLRALSIPPAPGADFALDDYAPPVLAWTREPAPIGSISHGVVELEAVLRWRF